MLRSSVIGRNASQKDYSNIEDREKNEEMRREELVVYPSIHHALSMCSQQPFKWALWIILILSSLIFEVFECLKF